jgi:hypothetical protein
VIEVVEYHGWKNCVRMTNDAVELIVTCDVGPRVISYKLNGGENVMAEFADQLGKSGESDWVVRGGHRLWTAPEDLTRTYSPDNSRVDRSILDNSPAHCRFHTSTDSYGIRKELEIALSKSGSGVTVTHTITNAGEAPTQLAIWALSVMAPGGVEIIPLPEKRPHPGPPRNAKSASDFAPNQTIVFWPFSDFSDPRWTFGSRFILLRQDPKRGPMKIGLAHRMGWVGYLNLGVLFVKRFDFQEGTTYADNGCNFESFTNEQILEVESLGPLVSLQPNESAAHIERWELHQVTGDVKTEADAARIAALLSSTPTSIQTQAPFASSFLR